MKNNLKALRLKKGYTQIAVQMKTGIEQALLSKFENGERVPPTETLVKLADFYNVSIDYILCRICRNKWSDTYEKKIYCCYSRSSSFVYMLCQLLYGDKIFIIWLT